MARFAYSRKTESLARKHDFSPEELAFIDLVSCGWERRDAYLIAFNAYDITKEAVDRRVTELLSRPKSKSRIADNKYFKQNKDVEEEAPQCDDDGNISKESFLKELTAAKAKAKSGSKEWLDICKMIADITRMKQEEIVKEDKTVHFYLPLTCNRCRLYSEYEKNKDGRHD